jgi:4-hydroxybenzoate polyprenyltransferase
VVFAGLLFGQRARARALLDPHDAAFACAAFAIFCALAGVVYLINDVFDRDADARHPVKSRRPIASGAVPPAVALGTAAVLGAGGIGGAFWLDPRFGLIALAYVALQGLYSIVLKHIVILDVIAIAVGFVLRAAGGAVVIGVSFSHWLLVLTFLLMLFLALSKRRAEIVSLADNATAHRRTLAHYSPYLLDQMISVVTASTLLAYAFYTISPDTIQKFGTDRLIYTLPFPLYGIFRYLYLVHQRAGGGSPSELVIDDRPLLACFVLWVGAVAVILYGPWR